MAHYQQLKFVSELSNGLREYFENKKVLEVGSWDVNGSIRGFFKDCDYTGADVAPGPGVDIVCFGQDIKLPDSTFDTVISCECFEHNSSWKETFSNMVRMLKPEGLCIVTCATLGRSEHGTNRTNPDASLTALSNYPDYYKNLKPKDFYQAFNLAEMFSEHLFILNPYSKDLYFVALKRSQGEPSNQLLNEYLIKRLRSIKREKPTNRFKQLRVWIKFYYRYAIATLLGEKIYHNLRSRR